MRKTIVVAAAAAVFATSAFAAAQEETKTYWRQKVDAPNNAWELSVGTGYTQPFGLVQTGSNINDIAAAGAGVEVGSGWRITPQWMVGGTLQYQELTSQLANTSGVRGGTGTIDVTFHAMPYDRVDPWVKLGTGYRMLWMVTNNSQVPNNLIHGLELGRLAVGLDVRTAPEFSIGPMVGADLNVFLWDRPDGGSNTTISNPRLNTFIYAGLQARFDVGTMAGAPSEVARR